MTDAIVVHAEDGTLHVTFNRPKQRNAMTWEMYEGVVAACERADADDSIRLMVLRGAGGDAFVAGTDISQFQGFTGADGVAYEERIGSVLQRLAAVQVPTIAAIEGFCIGGGLGIAAVTDLRICNSTAKFGVPIARTLGNCLSLATLSVLVGLIGRTRTTDLLMTARLMPADEALDAGLVSTVAADLDDELAQLVQRLLSHAPLTLWAVKEGLRRIQPADLPADDDIVARVYGSDDFARSVESFIAKEKPVWRGR